MTDAKMVAEAIEQSLALGEHELFDGSGSHVNDETVIIQLESHEWFEVTVRKAPCAHPTCPLDADSVVQGQKLCHGHASEYNGFLMTDRVTGTHRGGN